MMLGPLPGTPKAHPTETEYLYKVHQSSADFLQWLLHEQQQPSQAKHSPRNPLIYKDEWVVWIVHHHLHVFCREDTQYFPPEPCSLLALTQHANRTVASLNHNRHFIEA